MLPASPALSDSGTAPASPSAASPAAGHRVWRLSLRQTIGLLLAGGIFLIAGAIALNAYRASRQALYGFARTSVDQKGRLFAEALSDFLSDLRETLHLSQDLLQAGAIGSAQRSTEALLSGQDAAALETYLFSVLSAKPALSNVCYGDESGAFLMVSRETKTGAISTKRIEIIDGQRRVTWRHRRPGAGVGEISREERDDADRFDPRVRPWYRGAVGLTQAGRVHFTEVYVFHSDRQPGITASAPLRAADGRLRGVLSVDLNLLDLSRFLQGAAMGQAGAAFLIDGNQGLVATSFRDPPRPVQDQAGLRLRRLAESAHPELAALAGVLERSGAGGLDALSGRPLRFAAGGQDYLATLLPLPGEIARFRLGVLTLEDDLLGDARRAHYRNLAGALVAALLGLVGGLVLTGGIARALGGLVRETERVRALEFQPSPGAVAGARFREIYEVLLAFEGMKAGLRAFQKYVPLSLVRTLLDAGAEPRLGGEIRELTVFFSDIRGFTSLSESLRPQELAEKLGRYLSVVTEAIHAQRGTVDKYIGDGVMAFWGAPQPLAAHAEAACRAALSCQRAILTLSGRHSDQPEFPTRIGLHTAEVLVGNFGSADRLNYTVLGDGVNVASRLEQLCGHFGVQILISERTRALLDERFVTRRLGPVAIRGRERPMTVYELLGEDGGAPSIDSAQRSGAPSIDARRLARARAYEDALADFLAQRFVAAREQLQRLLNEGDDAAARRLLAAIELAAGREALPPGWTPAL